jgi:hypothetical protein
VREVNIMREKAVANFVRACLRARDYRFAAAFLLSLMHPEDAKWLRARIDEGLARKRLLPVSQKKPPRRCDL